MALKLTMPPIFQSLDLVIFFYVFFWKKRFKAKHASFCMNICYLFITKMCTKNSDNLVWIIVGAFYEDMLPFYNKTTTCFDSKQNMSVCFMKRWYLSITKMCTKNSDNIVWIIVGVFSICNPTVLLSADTISICNPIVLLSGMLMNWKD